MPIVPAFAEMLAIEAISSQTDRRSPSFHPSGLTLQLISNERSE
jgi:hypothetical protein